MRRPIIAGTIVVLVVVGTLVVCDLLWRRDRVLQTAERRADRQARILAEYLHGSFASADAALRQLVVHGQRHGGASGSAEDWEPILAAARAALPESGSISVTDAKGTIVHSTQKLIVGQSRANDYLFLQLARGDEQLLVDKPFASVSQPRQYIIPVGCRLERQDGGFDGIVVVTLIPEHYRDFLRTLDVGPSGTVEVLHPAGLVLFREPSEQNPINERADDDPVLNAARQTGEGVLHPPLAPGDRAGITAYRRLDSPLVIAAVTLDRDDVLRDWYGQRRVSAAALGVLTITIGAMVFALVRLADREQEARKDIEAASYMKDEFLMTVSHELRTPLTAIYGWVRVLASKEMSKAEQLRALKAIERNAVAQTRLIEDLLDVSRAISGKLRLESRPIDVAAVVRAAVESLGAALQARRITLDLSLDDSIGLITADPDRLQQVVWNLLSNAIKFTPEGGTVHLALARTGAGQIEILVRDTGVGIAADFLPFAFERFRQADGGTRRRYGGLGLGLAIVRHIVELHGGTVGAASDGEGAGSTFRVRLPMRIDAPRPDASPLPSAPAAAALPLSRLDGVRVVVVDDERDARELFLDVLEGAGARVRTAASAAEALQLLRAEDAHLLLTDIEMPAVDGYELLRRVLADERIRRSGVVPVALTAYARAADRQRALDAGFREHIAKPVDPVALVATIASVVFVNRAGLRT